MPDSLMWLSEVERTPWAPLAEALRRGLPVPNGFVVVASTPEQEIRDGYEELKVREKTHFLAVRGTTHAVLNVIGPDALIHTLRRFWAEAPDSMILIQRMIHSAWCGKAQRHEGNLHIKVNEGMMILDPDTYVLDLDTLECLHRAQELKQRKMIRRVDGQAKVIAIEVERLPMPDGALAKVADLSGRAGENIGWAIDDLDRIWLVSVEFG
jgi:hypothetical protein